MKRIFVLVGIIGLFVITAILIMDWRQKKELLSYFSNIREVENVESKPYYTFMTYNIQMGFKKYDDPWKSKQIGGTEDNLMQLVQAIKAENPDVVALQEIAKGCSNIKVKEQLKFLAQKLNMNYAFGARGHTRGEIWGNAILSKYNIVSIQNHELFYKNRWNQSTSLESSIDFPEGLVTVFSAHVGHEDQKDQVKIIGGLIRESTNPVILMGDFNLLPDSECLIPITEKLIDTCKEIKNEHSRFVEQHGTINLDPQDIETGVLIPPLKQDGTADIGAETWERVPWRIDYIFTSKSFEVVNVGLIPSQYWEVSDHVGYFAQLRFEN